MAESQEFDIVREPVGEPYGDKPSKSEPEEELSDRIEGVVERVIYQNEENGWAVAILKPIEGEEFTMTGTFLNLGAGLELEVRGKWKNHPRYGRQLEVTEFDTTMPRSLMGIRKYMASFIKGIGPKMAKKIVEYFGEDTIEIVEKDPSRLREVPGIGKGKATMIIDSWDRHRKIRNVMMFLQSHNVGPGTAMKIYNTYGDASVQVLKQNPYVLAYEITGIGFKIADRIAMNLGMEKDSPVRVEAGLQYTLEMATNEGHVYLPEEELVQTAAEMLECSEDKAQVGLSTLLSRGDRITNDSGKIYLLPYHYAETSVASRLAGLLKEKASGMFQFSYTEQDIKNVEDQQGFPLSNQQRSVLDLLGDQKVVILTGGPGTGKTISIRAVVSLFKKCGFKVEQAAPTGRAAKRMTEATGFPSRTIHRLLEYNPRPPAKFERDLENPIEADLVIIDETSMIDTVLMWYLVRAIPKSSRLLLVGDVDQLPSVGPGNVLRDLISSGIIPTIRLDVVYRQEAQSSIVGNAHLVNQGEMPVMASNRDGNFFFTQKDDPEDALQTIVRLSTSKLAKLFKVNPKYDVQVIAPMYKGVLGVDNLNTVMREHLNPGRDIKCGSRVFRLSDRVMQIKNNYDKEVFNGDVGFVRAIDLEDPKMIVDFSDHRVSYTFDELDELVLAYAITVHKSQGSEYPVVVMPVSTLHYTMLQRNLLYTAITRAKKLVVLVGTKKALAIAVKNNKIEERYTALAQRLEAEMNQRNLFEN